MIISAHFAGVEKFGGLAHSDLGLSLSMRITIRLTRDVIDLGERLRGFFRAYVRLAGGVEGTSASEWVMAPVDRQNEGRTRLTNGCENVGVEEDDADVHGVEGVVRGVETAGETDILDWEDPNLDWERGEAAGLEAMGTTTRVGEVDLSPVDGLRIGTNKFGSNGGWRGRGGFF